MSGTLAVQPISTRGRRSSTPRRIAAAAVLGGMVSIRLALARPLAASDSETPDPYLAVIAMRVAIPPGWTQVTPTLSGASSDRSASVKPRTANLLAQ